MINIGDKVKCVISGFEGIATSRTEYINGCIRFGVQPEKLTKEGKPLDAEFFDEKQLVVTKAKKVVMEAKRTGGPAPSPRLERNPN